MSVAWLELDYYTFEFSVIEMLETGNLINGQKYKDLSNQMMVINSRLKEIQETLINSHSSLSDVISRIIFDLNQVLVDEFAQYQTVSLQSSW